MVLVTDWPFRAYTLTKRCLKNLPKPKLLE